MCQDRARRARRRGPFRGPLGASRSGDQYGARRVVMEVAPARGGRRGPDALLVEQRIERARVERSMNKAIADEDSRAPPGRRSARRRSVSRRGGARRKCGPRPRRRLSSARSRPRGEPPWPRRKASRPRQAAFGSREGWTRVPARPPRARVAEGAALPPRRRRALGEGASRAACPETPSGLRLAPVAIQPPTSADAARATTTRGSRARPATRSRRWWHRERRDARRFATDPRTPSGRARLASGRSRPALARQAPRPRPESRRRQRRAPCALLATRPRSARHVRARPRARARPSGTLSSASRSSDAPRRRRRSGVARRPAKYLADPSVEWALGRAVWPSPVRPESFAFFLSPRPVPPASDRVSASPKPSARCW